MDQIMKKLPEHYYPTMYLDGFTPEQVLMTARRDWSNEHTVQLESSPVVLIRTEMHQK